QTETEATGAPQKHHYTLNQQVGSITDYIKPDYVHVLYQGRIVKSGDFSLVKQLEEQGYGWLTEQQ
ncbi:hypothetical protein M0O81_16745, partial [Klebsiella pneumoniae]|nr:hypothetical protein [Klebsiella pneumoniae]